MVFKCVPGPADSTHLFRNPQGSFYLLKYIHAFPWINCSLFCFCFFNSLLFLMKSFSLCGGITVSLFIHPLRDIWVDSRSGQLWRKLLWTFTYGVCVRPVYHCFSSLHRALVMYLKLLVKPNVTQILFLWFLPEVLEFWTLHLCIWSSLCSFLDKVLIRSQSGPFSWQEWEYVSCSWLYLTMKTELYQIRGFCPGKYNYFPFLPLAWVFLK